MCPLFETIRIESGLPKHLFWHECRMNRARLEIWKKKSPVSLSETIHVPEGFTTGLVRCNIYYGPEIREIVFKKYEKRIIRSLKLVNGGDIDYHLKYGDRSILESLFALRGDCDEILIVKNGFITDTSVSNIIFKSGNLWVTPANPLLPGTCRERLLKEGKIFERRVRPVDLALYQGYKPINAMRYPEEMSLQPVSSILW